MCLIINHSVWNITNFGQTLIQYYMDKYQNNISPAIISTRKLCWHIISFETLIRKEFMWIIRQTNRETTSGSSSLFIFRDVHFLGKSASYLWRIDDEMSEGESKVFSFSRNPEKFRRFIAQEGRERWRRGNDWNEKKVLRFQ